jgi:hypothetical protein
MNSTHKQGNLLFELHCDTCSMALEHATTITPHDHQLPSQFLQP